MSTGYFLRKYDRTTCGGVIYPSQDKFKILGLPVARAGDSVTCGKDGNVYQIMGSVPKMSYKGIGLAGSIHSKSTCPCMSELLPSCEKAKYSTDHMVLSPSAMRASVFDLGIPQHAQAAHKKPEPEKLPDTCACDRDISMAEFKKIATRAPADKIQEYLDALNLWMPWNGITTCREKAHFLAQASVETGSFNSMVEGNGNAKPYSPYYGRGIMQLTKKENYTSYGNYASFDFTNDAHSSYDNVAKHPHSFLSGFWYYCIHTDCSSSAEKDDFNMITARINGGFNGYNQRLSKFNEISMILKTEHLCKLEKSNVFSFEDSEIYNYKAYAYAWGRWHDHNDNSAIGTDKDANEALKGYVRAKYLYQAHNDTDMVKKIDKRISEL